MVKILSDYPAIGTVAAFGSSVMIALKDFFTNEGILYSVQIFGIYIGLMIGILTLGIKVMEFVRGYKKGV